MAASDYLEQRVLDFILRNAAEHSFTSPTTVYVALFTTTTTDAGGGTEVTNANAYARTAITFGAIGTSTTGVISNSTEISFTEATGSWGTISHFAIVDSNTYGGGNFLYHGALDASKVIDNGDTFTLPIGDIDVIMS